MSDTPARPTDAVPAPDPAGPPLPAGNDAAPATGGGPVSRVGPGLRFAFGTLTVLPVRVRRWDRQAARAGMLCAPLAGAVVGLAAGAVGAVLLLLGAGSLTAAVAAVAVAAVLTRGLHLDGLADVADGLGSGKDAAGALAVMKRSDIGPFGVVTLVLVLLAQVAVLDGLFARGWAVGAWGCAVAALASRTALTFAARRGVPAARPEGLGAVVAQTVPGPGAWAVGAGVALVAAAGGVLVDASGLPGAALQGVAAVVVGVGAAELLLRRCVRRLGGVTGDVFGAVAEVAALGCLLPLAVG
ncbi:adenosylcobinamide-GDP ribazoletransferase [Streptomyces sp. JJ66]|uniref:adenosylcobinamide-GDP ribazoletransferase n=1 Tax=Streptomyces sp. JJ66 TaxID=2803843 RepID=UPI001C57673E|nr:adenosylcobinamide-GDP ribazoletransferase [Streptomyces sp. JJ66]MBW1601615.1 adenosylcobinamide-GDP ribazoletransferase [Streptomyces sp. JJ66]